MGWYNKITALASAGETKVIEDCSVKYQTYGFNEKTERYNKPIGIKQVDNVTIVYKPGNEKVSIYKNNKHKRTFYRSNSSLLIKLPNSNDFKSAQLILDEIDRIDKKLAEEKIKKEKEKAENNKKLYQPELFPTEEYIKYQPHYDL